MAGRWIISMFLFCVCNFASAQVFQRLTEDNGLPINIVNDISQDSFGFIWIATESGLVRFDGVHTKVYQYNKNDSTAISTDSPSRLHYGESGNLWISSDESVVNRYDVRNDCFERCFIKELSVFPDSRIYSMLEDGDILWIGGEFGFVKYNWKNKEAEITHPPDLLGMDRINPLSIVHGFILDNTNSDLLYLLTRGGLISYYKSSQKAIFHAQPFNELKESDQGFKRGFQDSEGVLWMAGFRPGVATYNPVIDKWERDYQGYFPESDRFNTMMRIAPKSENEIWVAGKFNGFGILNRKTREYQFFSSDASNNNSVQPGDITALFVDNQDNVWIGGQHGVSFYNPSFQTIHTIQLPERRITHGNPNTYVSFIAQISNDEVIIGTNSAEGLYRGNLQTGECSLVDNYVGENHNQMAQQAILEKSRIFDFYDMIKVSPDKIWISMHHQLCYYEVSTNRLVFPETTKRVEHMNTILKHFEMDADGFIWVLNRSSSNLVKLNAKSGEILETLDVMNYFPDAFSDEEIYGIWNFAIHPNGKFWFTSYSGVFILDIDSKEVTTLPRYKDAGFGVEGESFFGMDISDSGVVYLSGTLNGLQVIDLSKEANSERYKLLTIADGLPVNRMIKVVTYQKSAWVTTRKGLFEYNEDTGKIRMFDRKEGILDNDLLNYWQPSLDISSNGLVFFGNPGKVQWLDANKLYQNKQEPKVLLTNLDVRGENNYLKENIQFTNKINLTSDENFFTVYYSLNDFTHPKDQRFKYRLIGYDNDWVDAGNKRYANYTKVKGGNYTFEVLGANNSGTWSTIPATLSIHVATPFFQSTLFFILMGLTILLMVYVLYRYRLSQVQEKEKIKSDFSIQLAEVEMTALRAQMNPHFVFNSLNSINKYILINEPREASRYLTKFSQLMRLILNNSNSKEVTLEEELKAIDLYIEMEQLRFNQKFNFEKCIKTEVNPNSILIPPMLLQPYLENAIWHGLMPQKTIGKLFLGIKQSNGSLICTIEDNGIGRKRAMEIKQKKGIRKKSMGMKITSDRIALVEALHNIKTKIVIEDRVNEQGASIGTKVIVHLPIQTVTHNKIKP